MLTDVYFIAGSFPFYLKYLFHKLYDIQETSADDLNIEVNTEANILVHALAYSNNSVNFIFYGLFSTSYRNELKKLVKKARVREQ